MLAKHQRTPATPPKQFVERRREHLNRAVVDGLQQLNEHMEQLPEGPQKEAALAAVACFAMRIADALEKMKVQETKTPEKKVTKSGQ
jgi:PIN domain nuclease of toxin-antitoxin system